MLSLPTPDVWLAAKKTDRRPTTAHRSQKEGQGGLYSGELQVGNFGFPIQIQTSRMASDGLRTITGEYGVINQIEQLIQCMS